MQRLPIILVAAVFFWISAQAWPSPSRRPARQRRQCHLRTDYRQGCLIRWLPVRSGQAFWCHRKFGLCLALSFGSITPCPATGVASAPATADAAATGSAAGVVATSPVVSPLGLSSSSNTCTTTTLPVTVTPSAVSGATFGDGAIPLDATEFGTTRHEPPDRGAHSGDVGRIARNIFSTDPFLKGLTATLSGKGISFFFSFTRSTCNPRLIVISSQKAATASRTSCKSFQACFTYKLTRHVSAGRDRARTALIVGARNAAAASSAQ